MEALAWVAAVVLLGTYLAATGHAELASSQDLHAFQRSALEIDSEEQALWSASRQEAYREALRSSPGLPEAVIRIPVIGLEAPVREGVDELTLNRSVGRVPATPVAGSTGNTVLAAHRDGFFRQLGEIGEGDTIVVQTLTGKHRYTVEETTIVDPDAVHVMAATEEPVLTLITCYPFYFVGPAPQRFVVRAVLEQSATGGNHQ